MDYNVVQPGKYIKYTWEAIFSTFNLALFSNPFQIDDLEEVFTIALSLTGKKLTPFDIDVYKSNPDMAHAVINISIGELEFSYENDAWSYQTGFTVKEFPKRAILLESSEDTGTKIFQVNVVCEIFWNGYLKNQERNQLFYRIKPFYNFQKFSDVTLVVGKIEIPAHKEILSGQSYVFSKMLESEIEKKENIIDIKGFDAEAVLEMLHFLYKGTTKASQDTEIALQMLRVSDIYEINELRKISEATLLKNMSVNNVLNIIDTADDHHALGLVKSAVNFIASNYNEVRKTSKSIGLCEKKPLLMQQVMDISFNKPR